MLCGEYGSGGKRLEAVISVVMLRYKALACSLTLKGGHQCDRHTIPASETHLASLPCTEVGRNC